MAFVTRTVPITAPRNSRVAEVAKTRLAAITPLAQQEIMNSMGVNSFPSLVYKKLVPGAGHVCTCSKQLDVSPGSPLFDADGNASQEHITSLLEGGEFGINDYGRSPTTGKQIGPNGSPVTTLQDPATLERNPTLTTTEPDDPLATQVVNEDDFVGEVNQGAYENGSCSICYGTGVVGGFQLYGGQRIIIDSTMPGLQLFHATVDQTQAPHQISLLAADAYAAFSMSLPFGATVQTVRVWNGRKQVPVWVQINVNGTWQPFDQTVAAQYMDGLPHQLRLTSMISQEITFTHAEIQLYQVGMIPIEFPHLSRTGDLSILDPVQDVSVYIPPTIPFLYPGDLIADSVYGRLWRLKTVQYNKDASMRNMAFECEARLVQDYEYLSDLWVPTGITTAQVTLEPRLNVQNPSNTIMR